MPERKKNKKSYSQKKIDPLRRKSKNGTYYLRQRKDENFVIFTLNTKRLEQSEDFSFCVAAVTKLWQVLDDQSRIE